MQATDAVLREQQVQALACWGVYRLSAVRCMVCKLLKSACRQHVCTDLQLPVIVDVASGGCLQALHAAITNTPSLPAP
jgi:hypothetical protein